jgi:hypothetical protein
MDFPDRSGKSYATYSSTFTRETKNTRLEFVVKCITVKPYCTALIAAGLNFGLDQCRAELALIYFNARKREDK